MIRVAIVDDEPLARQGIRLRLASEPDLQIVGEAADGAAALQLIAAELPDLVFLDIQMPGMNGFEVLEELVETDVPVLVFVTAHDQFAIRAFEVNAVDYLLKPFTRQRFDEAVRRARRELANRDDGIARLQSLLRPVERIAVRHRDRYVLVKVSDVDTFEAAANYVDIQVGPKSYLLRSTIANLERKLDARQFVRIHRSTIVNIERVAEIRPDAHADYDVTLTTGRVVRMSRNFSDRLLSRV